MIRQEAAWMYDLTVGVGKVEGNYLVNMYFTLCEQWNAFRRSVPVLRIIPFLSISLPQFCISHDLGLPARRPQFYHLQLVNSSKPWRQEEIGRTSSMAPNTSFGFSVRRPYNICIFRVSELPLNIHQFIVWLGGTRLNFRFDSSFRQSGRAHFNQPNNVKILIRQILKSLSIREHIGDW